MEGNKNIKMLLLEYGIEETSSTFNNNIMQRINTSVFTKQSKPLLNAFTLNLLKIIFFLIIIMLVASIMFLPFNNVPPAFSINVNSSIYKQLFSFIIVFWIGMLMNLWLNKKGILK